VAEHGDTYWGLAARVSPGGDLRSTVDALVRANGGRELRVGDRIELPR
jgi:DNA integrity scanning protein DisA with diadenylate cyclase activity